MTQELHIAISSDENYINHCYVLCKSVIESNKLDFEKIHIHFLVNKISKGKLLQFRTWIESKNMILHVYDLSDIESRLGIHIPPTISISAYARLFLGSLIADNISKLIYMDVDAINCGSLFELWNSDLNGYAVGGVLDHVDNKAKTRIGINPNDPYINSGFLLINLDFWRKNDLERSFLKFLHINQGNVFHHDQGIINAVCNHSKLIIPPQYNVITNFFTESYSEFRMTPFYQQKEIEFAIANPVFIHYTPGVANRPWIRNCKHPLAKIYQSYRENTPIGDSPLQRDNRPYRLRFLSWSYYHHKWLYRLILLIRGMFSDKI